ncbi:MAG: hypothetical protein ABI679_08000 [Gemmatimonadota bacterium]
MNAQALHRIRALVVAKGLTAASWIPEASEGRMEEASIRPARLEEDPGLMVHDVGDAEPWPAAVAFLDGIQRYDIVAHHGVAPLVIATIAAAVRERRDRQLRTVAQGFRRLAVGRPVVLAAAGDALEGLHQIPLDDQEPIHPLRDLTAVRRAVDRERGRLEIEVGAQYQRNDGDWLLVDGSLTASPSWANDPWTIGIVKSHSILPFEGADLERYLQMPCGSRSSVFAPAPSQVAPVFSWALRLWPWEGHDVFFGLIRIEAAPTRRTVEAADQISRWLLAERAPLSTPDARWDRLLYGFRAVEMFLKTG